MQKTTYKTIFILTLVAMVMLACNAPIAFASIAPNPAKAPRMVTFCFYGDNGTQMSFNWNTTDYCDSDVWVVEAADSQGFDSDKTIKTQGSFYISKASATDGYIHTCVVSNLKLNTKYLFKVGDADFNIWSEVGSFTTESGKADKFTFLHVSDPQADVKDSYLRYEEVLSSAVKTSSPRFIINTGDIVNNNWLGYEPNLQQWEWALTDTFHITKDYPIVASAGNHEAAAYDFASRFNFDVPENADVSSGCYYSFNYNKVHFICLNTNDTTGSQNATAARGLSDAQMQWLRTDLETNKNADWTVVFFHKAIYDGSEGGNNTDKSNYDVELIRNQIAPLFTQYGVDLVLQGHDHNYSRSYPILATVDNGALQSVADTKQTVSMQFNGETHQFYNNTKGTLYINSSSASGWKFSYVVPDYDRDLIEDAEDGQLMYAAITVDNDTLLVQWYVFDDYLNAVPYKSIGLYKGNDAPTTEPTPTKPNDDNPQPTPDNKALPTYAVVLIVVGSVLVVAGITVATVLLVKKRRNTATHNAEK